MNPLPSAAAVPPGERITQAAFQAAPQSSMLDSAGRRERRAKRRASIWPPGLIANRWCTARPFTYSYGSEDSAESYRVPEGYPFDGASVPWALTAFVPRSHSAYLAAAALHDFLYERAWQTVPRARADAVFREAMLVLGVNWFWALVMHRAVRAGGWEPWYARAEGTAVNRFLALPALLRKPPALLWIALAFAGGLALDLLSLGRARAEAARIAAADR